MTTPICQYEPCSKPMPGRRADARHCSKACARHAATRPSPPRICAHCGATFTKEPDEPGHDFRRRNTCSTKCADAKRAHSMITTRAAQDPEPPWPGTRDVVFPDGFWYEDVPGLDGSTLDSGLRP